MNKINDINEMLLAAAELLLKCDGDGFDDLRDLNTEWLQDCDSRDAMETLLSSMQENAYLLNDKN